MITIAIFYAVVITIAIFGAGLLFGACIEADQFNGERSYPHLFPKAQPGIRSAITGFVIVGLAVALVIGHLLK